MSPTIYQLMTIHIHSLVRPTKTPAKGRRHSEYSASSPKNQNAKHKARRGTISDNAVMPLENYHQREQSMMDIPGDTKQLADWVVVEY